MARRTSKKDPKYFAILPSTEIGPKIQNIVEDYKYEVRNLGLAQLWEESYYQYYRGYYTRGEIEYHGRQGEFRTVSFNHYRNLLQHILTQITGSRPAFEPQAVNADYKSTSQIQIARNLLDYYLDVKDLDEFTSRAAEYSVFLGEGYLIDEWDLDEGEVVVVNSNNFKPDFMNPSTLPTNFVVPKMTGGLGEVTIVIT